MHTQIYPAHQTFQLRRDHNYHSMGTACTEIFCNILKNVESLNLIEARLCVKELVGFCIFKAAPTCIQQLKALAVGSGSVQLDEDTCCGARARQVVCLVEMVYCTRLRGPIVLLL